MPASATSLWACAAQQSSCPTSARRLRKAGAHAINLQLSSRHIHLTSAKASICANFSSMMQSDLSNVQGGTEKLSDEEIEATLEKVVRLLAYINDKDLFAEFFRKKLARRLLQEKSSSDEHERSILSRLKQQCGAQFTSKVGTRSVCVNHFVRSYYVAHSGKKSSSNERERSILSGLK